MEYHIATEWCILLYDKMYTDRIDSESIAIEEVDDYVAKGIAEYDEFEIRRMTNREICKYD